MVVRRYFQNLIVVFALLAGFVSPVLAQTGDRCFWENPCTPTPIPTPTYSPGTPTPTPSPTQDPAATATATASLDESSFKPREFGRPTSIPDVDLSSNYPVPQVIDLPPIHAPVAISISFPDVTPVATMQFTGTIPISLTVTPAPVTFSLSYTAANPFTGTIGSLEEFTADVQGYTAVLTGQIAALSSTQQITVITAPDWYAPDLPRPVANVGWTFEQIMGPDGTVPNFSMTSWAGFGGYVVALPFSFARSIWITFAHYGPFGLFLSWLFITFLFTMIMHFWVFLLRMVAIMLRFLVRLAELLGEWVPTGG